MTVSDEDEDVPADVADALRRVLQREDRERAAFMSRLPSNYPEPRAEQEWQAYWRLRRFWSDRQIKKFISVYATDDMVFPGILDSPPYPSLREFNHDVGLLAGGKYARSRPAPEMLSHVAGAQA